MAFNVKFQYGDAIQTAKGNERAQVQLIELSDDQNRRAPQTRLEIRVVFGDDDTSSRTAIGFTDPAKVQDLIDTLTKALGHGKSNGFVAPKPVAAGSAPKTNGAVKVNLDAINRRRSSTTTRKAK